MKIEFELDDEQIDEIVIKELMWIRGVIANDAYSDESHKDLMAVERVIELYGGN